MFSYELGNQFIDKGKIFKNDSVSSSNFNSFTLFKKDTILLNVYCNEDTLVFKKVEQINVSQNLQDAVVADSIRKLVIGFWKFSSNKKISLFNYDAYYSKFTFQFCENGNTICYLNNFTDSTFMYTYQITPNGFYLNRGC